MPKRNRGKALKRSPTGVRGICPLCGKTGIKLLYDYRTELNETINVCKNCREK